jgi:Heavy metal associated domain 2
MEIPGIRVVHAIPGRVRLKIIYLRDNPELAREIRARLAGVQGIRRIEANPLTGSLLVLYDPEEITSLESLLTLSGTLIPVLPGLDLGDIAKWLEPSGNEADSNPSLAGGISAALGALNTRVGKATGGIDLKLLLPLTLFMLGIKGLLVASKVPFPAWYDLLWFAFGTYFMLNPPEPRRAP